MRTWVIGALSSADEEEEDVGHLKDLAAEAPIIKLVNMLITGAIESRPAIYT